MRITNHYSLPDAIVSAMESMEGDYSRGSSDITVTQLIDPPQIKQLLDKHGDELSEDCSDRLWALMGTAMHNILERAERVALVENRLYMNVNGWKLGGKYDRMCVSGGLLQDYKFSSVWEYIYGLKPERIAQLNILAELAIRDGYDITGLEVVMLFRDWRPGDAERKPDYPQSQIAAINVPLWPQEKRIAYIEERVRLHQKAASGDFIPCTDEERWSEGNKFAVMKKGRKSALKLAESEAAAHQWMMEKGISDADGIHHLEFRPGRYRRCEGYCSVSSVCPQWRVDCETSNNQ